MRRRSNILLACSMMVSLAALVAVGCAPAADGGGGGGVCDTFTNYKATVTTPPSFATDIMPILLDENATNGCGPANSNRATRYARTSVTIRPVGLSSDTARAYRRAYIRGQGGYS